VHVKGVYLLTRALLPLLADGGRIVNTSSGLARFAGPGYSVYGAMKGAVEVLTGYWARELGPRGITVNVVAPGPNATDFGGGYLRDNPSGSVTWTPCSPTIVMFDVPARDGRPAEGR
jgi:NAD(P)-dependent dehydrogenase (short-subunit alcohol dehydrogenase family)